MGLGVKKPIAKLTGSLFSLGMIILKIMEIEQKYLPTEILKRAILSVEEYGWKRSDIFEVIEKAIEVGCNEYITKPINKTLLLEMINMLID